MRSKPVTSSSTRLDGERSERTTSSSSSSLGTGELFFLIWLSIYHFSRLQCIHWYEYNVLSRSGYPKWKNALNVTVQCIQLPCLTVSAWWYSGGRSLRLWGIRWTAHQDRHRDEKKKKSRMMTWTVCFAYVFPTYLLLDFVIYEIPPMIGLHHAVCIGGHLASSLLGPPELYPYYVLGVTLFEIGSGMTNLFDFYETNDAEQTKRLSHVVAAVMTLSNLSGLWCAWKYCSHRGISAWLGGTLGVASMGLALMRQKETMTQIGYA